MNDVSNTPAFDLSVCQADNDALFRLAVEACPAGVILAGENGAIVFANAECERMFGYGPNELVGAPVDALVPTEARAAHGAQRRAFVGMQGKRHMGAGRDLTAVRKDGSRFPAEIGLTPMQNAGRRGVLAFVIDISERRRAEERELRHRKDLERANESLAQFAYVASHDIQEPLRKIVAFSDLLMTGLAENDRDEIAMASEVMRSSALRARRLVGDVLALARSMNDVFDLVPVPLRVLVDEALQALSQTIEDSGAAMTVEVEDAIVRADRVQGMQVVQNLVSNALKFHKPGQRPAVRIRTETTTPGRRRLLVEDEGVGFDPALRDEIFRPFRRLHRHEGYAGSGMGLAICNAIAGRLGWTLLATSRVGGGARFEIGFPADDGARPMASPP